MRWSLSCEEVFELMGWNEPEAFEVEATYLGESSKAIRVRIDNDDMWIPKSQILDDSEIYGGHPQGETGSLIMSVWIAKQKGIF